MTQEISKEERTTAWPGDYASEKKISLLTVMEKEAEEDSCADAGADHSFQRDVCHPCLGQIKRTASTPRPAPSKNAINSMNSAQYFEQPAEHLEESVLSNMAGLDLGALRASQTVLRAPLPRRHAAPLRAHSPAT